MGFAQLWQIQKGVADSGGHLTLTFDQIPPSQVAQGTVSVFGPANAPPPSSAIGQAIVDNVPWGNQWAAAAPSFSVTAIENQTLVVTLSGLVAGTTYSAAWIGSLHPLGEFPLVGPGGSPLGLAPGSSVGLAAGASVGLAAGSSVGLAAGSSVGIAGTATVSQAAGSQLSTAAGLPLQPSGDQLLSGDLGTGTDGAVTISANATLTRDMNYSSLTVNPGVTLSTGGYIIRCQGTVGGTGTIDNSGTSATASVAGVGGATGTLVGGANGVLVGASTSGSAAGLAPSAADVEGGAGGNVTGANPAGAGAVTPSAALGGSVSGLRSLRYAGGASGGVGKSNTASGIVASGGAGGAVIIVCNNFNGPTVTANAGAGTIQANAIAGAGGSGGGSVFVFCRTFTAGSVQALGSAGVSAGSNTANPGGPGRAQIVSTQ